MSRVTVSAICDVTIDGESLRLEGRAVVLASGGFQADLRLAHPRLGACGGEFPDPGHAL